MILYEPEIIEVLLEWKKDLNAARHFYDCELFWNENTIRSLIEIAKNCDFYPEYIDTVVILLKAEIHLSQLEDDLEL